MSFLKDLEKANDETLHNSVKDKEKLSEEHEKTVERRLDIADKISFSKVKGWALRTLGVCVCIFIVFIFLAGIYLTVIYFSGLLKGNINKELETLLSKIVIAGLTAMSTLFIDRALGKR